MTNQILFTSVFNNSILTKIKVDYQDISVLTKVSEREQQKFVSLPRGDNFDENKSSAIEVAASDVTSAVKNHIALVNAVLENKHHDLKAQQLAAYYPPTIDTDNNPTMDNVVMSSSFNTPYTKKMLAATIGFDAQASTDLKNMPLVKYALVACLVFLAFNVTVSFAVS